MFITQSICITPLYIFSNSIILLLRSKCQILFLI
nr:MAG TPA: hypothetical protein [Caudoviricetes sp.]